MLSQKLRRKSIERSMKHQPLDTTHMYTHAHTHTLIHIQTHTPVHKHQNVYTQSVWNLNEFRLVSQLQDKLYVYANI